MLTSAFWSSTGKRGVRWTLFGFLALCLLVGCTDPTATNRSLTELQQKLNQLETQISARNAVQDEEFLATSYAYLYFLNDLDRDQTTIAHVYSKRSIQTGEIIFVNDDVWRVEAVKIFTEEKPPEKAEPSTSPTKNHLISAIQLLVKFQAKARKPAIPPVSASPTPR
jgi:hypothetical protein